VKEEQRNEIKVGLTVIAGLLVLLFGFSVFKNWSIGKEQFELRMHFPQSSGLQRGDQVSVNGVRCGEVADVRLENGGVLVTALIESDVVVHQDAVPVIQMLELMGGKKIDIRQTSDGIPVDAGLVLRGRVDPDIAGALGVLGQAEGNITSITAQADSLLRSLNAVAGDKALISSVKETVANLHAITGDLRGYISRNDDKLDRITGNLLRLTDRADTLMADLQPRIGTGIDKAETVLGNADSLVTDVRTLLAEIRDSRGLLHTALHDTTLVRRMDAMLVKLDSLSSIIINGEFRTSISLF
jgi:phospholipid/cholesterol/gamma-HCH transport system substrate-binding protein